MNDANNSISTEELGIESQIQSANTIVKNSFYLRKPNYYLYSEENDSNKAKYNTMKNYDKDSINFVEHTLYYLF